MTTRLTPEQQSTEASRGRCRASARALPVQVDALVRRAADRVGLSAADCRCRSGHSCERANGTVIPIRGRGANGQSPPPGEAWLGSVAEAAAAQTSVPAELLGDYLTMLAEAAVSGHRRQRNELGHVRTLGQQAAEQGIDAGQVIDLYLSAASHLWADLPCQVRDRDPDALTAAGEAVLRVVGDAVAVLVEGHQAERRHMVRREEAIRREIIDDLLRGDSDVARMVERVEPFGLDPTRPHVALLATPAKALADPGAATRMLDRAIIDRFGDRDVFVATKGERIVILVPDPATSDLPRTGFSDVGAFVHTALRRLPKGSPWRIAVGRPYPGAYGIARSYEEARDALTLTEHLRLTTPVVNARDLLVYRVLARDQVAIIDLVQDMLAPLTQARGGADPLLSTLLAYFETGGVATEAARRLHMSVRTVTYRLNKIASLTGHDPTDPAEQLGLHIAVVGARLLRWPERDLSIVG
jgi:sugar diacid utilization regulator